MRLVHLQLELGEMSTACLYLRRLGSNPVSALKHIAFSTVDRQLRKNILDAFPVRLFTSEDRELIGNSLPFF